MPEKTYPSAVDAWLAVLLIAGPLVAIVVGLSILGQSIAGGLVAMGSGIFSGGLIAVLCLPCQYTLTDQALKIKAGLLEEDVSLERIRSAEKSRNPLSAPALSLNRVKVTLDNGFRLVSPKDRDAFIADLESRVAARRG